MESIMELVMELMTDFQEEPVNIHIEYMEGTNYDN